MFGKHLSTSKETDNTYCKCMISERLSCSTVSYTLYLFGKVSQTFFVFAKLLFSFKHRSQFFTGACIFGLLNITTTYSINDRYCLSATVLFLRISRRVSFQFNKYNLSPQKYIINLRESAKAEWRVVLCLV